MNFSFCGTGVRTSLNASYGLVAALPKSLLRGTLFPNGASYSHTCESFWELDRHEGCDRLYLIHEFLPDGIVYSSTESLEFSINNKGTVFSVMFCTKHESSCVKFNKCSVQKLLLPSGLELVSESSESGALSLSSAARHIDFHLLRRIYVALVAHSIALSLHKQILDWMYQSSLGNETKHAYDHGRPVCRAWGATSPPRFCEANVKSLILTIGAPPDLYCALPVLLICPPSFHSHRAPMRMTTWIVKLRMLYWYIHISKAFLISIFWIDLLNDRSFAQNDLLNRSEWSIFWIERK